jgi:hypothetical protein
MDLRAYSYHLSVTHIYSFFDSVNDVAVLTSLFIVAAATVGFTS